jgi:hypothetical protein
MTYAKTRVPLIAAALLALGTTVAAEQPDYRSANAWFLGCKAFAENNARTVELMVDGSYCGGIVHGLSAVSQVLPPKMQYCAPVTSTASQLMRVVVRYIEAQPQRMHEDLRQLVLEAFHNAWPRPCR